MSMCVVCRRQIRDTAEAASDEGGPSCTCANPVPELRPLSSSGGDRPAQRSGNVEWGSVAGSWSIGNSRLQGRSRQLGENEELTPLGQQPAPLASWDRMETCPKCGMSVRRSKLGKHLESDCLGIVTDPALAPASNPGGRKAAAPVASAGTTTAPSTAQRPARSAPAATTPTGIMPNAWLQSSSYTIVIHSRLAEGAAMRGYYLLHAGAERINLGLTQLVQESVGEEVECMALIAALTELLARLAVDGQQASGSSLTVYCRREPLLHQLQGEGKVKSATLQPLVNKARNLLSSFAQIDLQWRPSREVERVFKAPAAKS